MIDSRSCLLLLDYDYVRIYAAPPHFTAYTKPQLLKLWPVERLLQPRVVGVHAKFATRRKLERLLSERPVERLQQTGCCD